METKAMQARLTELLLKEGAARVGYAELSSLPTETHHGLDYAVSIVIALDRAIVSRIKGGPDHAYYHEYKRANALLAKLGQCGVRYLKGRGYQAVALPPTGEDFDPVTLSATMPHKTVATRAGIGWIGKSALLITEQYGASIRLTTILTNASLETAAPTNTSRCGECVACVEACPGRAILGHNWEAGMDRELFFNAAACYRTARAYAVKLEIDATICGICIAACPWTKKYTCTRVRNLTR